MPSVAISAPSGDRLVLGFDLTATFVFGLEGASSGVDANLDLLGVLVIGFITALGGGIVRDVIIGDVPPAAFQFQRYIVCALLGGIIAFAVFEPLHEAPAWILIGLDAAGLSLFAVSGASKALLTGANPLTAVILGAVTGAGGGIMRDVLVNKAPAVLRINIYASAALLGANRDDDRRTTRAAARRGAVRTGGGRPASGASSGPARVSEVGDRGCAGWGTSRAGATRGRPRPADCNKICTGRCPHPDTRVSGEPRSPPCRYIWGSRGLSHRSPRSRVVGGPRVPLCLGQAPCGLVGRCRKRAGGPISTKPQTHVTSSTAPPSVSMYKPALGFELAAT
jgi:uncharacterized membrane protein YeiH